MKHRLPSVFKKPCKNIYSTKMENRNNSIYMLSAVFWSFLSLGDNAESCHRRFSQIFMLFQLRKLCVRIPPLLSRNPRLATKTALITPSYIYLLLTFVNVAKKDVAVSRFTVPAAGANAIRKTQNRFSRNHHAGKFLELN